MEVLLSSAALQGVAFDTLWERGRDYAARGKVARVELSEFEASGLVDGNLEEPYRVELRVELPKQAVGGSAPAASCSCPFGESVDPERTWCKHLIAFAIVAERTYRVERESAAMRQACEPEVPRRPSPRL